MIIYCTVKASVAVCDKVPLVAVIATLYGTVTCKGKLVELSCVKSAGGAP